MKNLYSKSKGKIYPSPATASPSPPPASPNNKDALSVLNLLPAAILALVSVMGVEDREVLAYLLLRSMKTPSLMLQEKKKCKKAAAAIHRPLLDCPCFDCYTSFWIRWDSSPNRELIHQAIEAFEEHLAKGESSNSKKGRKKDRRAGEKSTSTAQKVRPGSALISPAPGGDEVADGQEIVSNSHVGNLRFEEEEEVRGSVMFVAAGEQVAEKEHEEGAAAAMVAAPAPAGHSRGLVRKVWPDMMGMFNSRLWGLWNPNV